MVTFEPKNQNRFYVTWPQELNIPSYATNEVSRISCTMTHSQGGLVYHGKRWDDVTFNIYDILEGPSKPSIIESIHNHFNQPIEVLVQQLAPSGGINCTWILNGVIKEVNIASLSYKHDTQHGEIQVVLAVQSAVYLHGDELLYNLEGRAEIDDQANKAWHKLKSMMDSNNAGPMGMVFYIAAGELRSLILNSKKHDESISKIKEVMKDSEFLNWIFTDNEVSKSQNSIVSDWTNKWSYKQ